MDFKNALKELKVKHLGNTDLLASEEDTKRVLVVPFIKALGYDTLNPREFVSEFSVAGGGRVDYVIQRDGKTVVIVECKPVSNARLIDDRGQLRRYFNAAKPDVAILTNGVQYQFFSDVDREGEMDSEPFLEVDLGDCDDEDFGEPGAPAINSLAAFTKSEFSANGVRETATLLKYKSGIRRFLEQQFSGDELHPDLVVLLARRVYQGRLMDNVKTQLGGLSKEAISEFKSAMAKASAIRPQHTTTSDEIEGHYIVKNILWDVVDGDRVVMRDGASYCTLQLDESPKSRKIVCRLRFNNLSRKRIGLLDGDKEEQVRIEALGEINNYAERIRQTARQILAREG